MDSTTQDTLAGQHRGLVVLEQHQHDTLIRTSITLNTLSILACSILLISYYRLKDLSPILLNRVSLRLIVAAAACTIFYSVAQVASNLLQGESILCSLSVYVYFAFALVTAFLISAVTFNLQLVFLRREKETHSMELRYYVTCFTAAFVIPLPAFIAGRYGWTSSEQTCWIRDEGSVASLWWLFASYHLWILSALVYNIVVVMWVMRKLYRNRKFVQVDMLALTQAQERLSKGVASGTVKALASKEKRKRLFIEMMQMVARIVQYPLVLIVTQLPNVLTDLMGLLFAAASPFWLLLVAYITTALQGILVSAVFWYDPTVRRSLDHVKQQLVYEYLEGEQKKTTVDEWGLELAKEGTVPTKRTMYGRWKRAFVAKFLVSQQDLQDLRKAQQEAREKAMFQPALQEPEPSLVVERVRTYELEVGELVANELDEEEEAHDEEYWETVKLNL